MLSKKEKNPEVVGGSAHYCGPAQHLAEVGS